MRLLKKALLATDFGEASQAAASTAARLASVFGAEILPFHVLREVPGLPADAEAEDARLSVDDQCRELIAEFERRGVSCAPPVVARGAPFQQILMYANAQDVNVIMIGAGDRRSKEGIRLGVTPERVVRRSLKPVWVVQPGAPDSIERVFCAVDFSEHSRRGLANAVHLARSFGAELVVFTVLESDSGLLSSGSGESHGASTAYAEAVQDRFEALMQGHDLHGIKVRERIGRGEPEEEILRVVTEERADLLVMGSAGRSGFARFFLGSVAGAVLREAPCSVLTVKAESVVRMEFESRVDELKSRFERGCELLDKGFPQEALVELEPLRADNAMAAPVWEALAVAHLRLGHSRQSAHCASRAEYLRNTLWKQLLESEIRREHPMLDED
jgi:nucleotide-binding universal stress UspA family protein